MKPHLAAVAIALAGVIGAAPRPGYAQSTPLASTASRPVLSHQSTSDAHVLTIAVDTPEDVEVWVEGTELLMSFPRASPSFDALELQDRLSGWVESVSIGYDTVLLRLVQGVRAEVEAEGLSLRVRLSGEPAPGASDGEPGALRLEQLRAQVLLRQRELARAREEYSLLRARMPDSPAPLAGLADVEVQAGHWRRGLAMYREALALDPDNPSWKDAIEQLERAQSDRVSVGAEARRSRGGRLDAPVQVALGSFRVSHHLDEALRFNVEGDLAHVHTDRVQRSSGLIEAFSGERYRAAVTAQHDALSGLVTGVSAFAGTGAQGGAGLSLRQPDDGGSTSALLEWRRPNWDYVEGLIDGVTRDRLAASRVQRLGSDVTGRLEIGRNRYLQSAGDELGASATLSAELRVGRLAGEAPLALVYSVTGEYFSGLSTRVNASNQTYSPLPLVNREIHLLTLGYSGKPWAREGQDALSLDAYAGVGGDRYGRNGALAAATLTYLHGTVEFQLRLAHVVNVGRTAGRTDSMGAVLAFRY